MKSRYPKSPNSIKLNVSAALFSSLGTREANLGNQKKGNKKSSNRMQFGNNFPKVCCHNTQLSPMLHAVTPTPRQLPQIAAARN